jgi:ubiquinone/menaquinone biosynthesis C-methylase UbiE
VDQTEKVESFWEKEVADGGIYTVPCLDLSAESIDRYVRGESEELPGFHVYPRCLLQGLEGKKVLCLASGGGQQSAVFGLLGADVTVLDIAEGQLNGDRIAAEHYGYMATIVKGDMRDLSAFADEEFDLIYQPVSICFVPDVREVYQGVYRVLKPGGTYAVSHVNPSTYPIYFVGGGNGWDGTGYRIAEIYTGGPIRVSPEGVENMRTGEPTGEYRHLLSDIFGGLMDVGFAICNVVEDPRHTRGETSAAPGSYEHSLAYVAEYFTIVCGKPGAFASA